MFTLNCKGRILVVDKPIVMGIINVTPDSFFEGSRFQRTDAILGEAEKMLKEGATVLDIGGQSTRPGSELLSPDEELKRIIEPVQAISRDFPDAIISIDTFHSRVATDALSAGASIVNDVSGGNFDARMFPTVASFRAPYVLMHMRGTPQDMQANPQYQEITREIMDYFIHQLSILTNAGLSDVIIDPGFGFGKTALHNFELLKHLSIFKMLERPILIGISRKSTIYKSLQITVDEALNGTTVLNTIGLLNGANILRVHDVRPAMEAIKLVKMYLDPIK